MIYNPKHMYGQMACEAYDIKVNMYEQLAHSPVKKFFVPPPYTNENELMRIYTLIENWKIKKQKDTMTYKVMYGQIEL